MKKFFAVSVFALTAQFLFAQLNAGNDTTICSGTAVQLQATGGTTYTWTPNNNLNGANTATPVATPTTTTTYVVSSPVSSSNIVVNGDFAQGNTGFTTEYIYDSPTNANGSGAYFVGSNASTWNNNMQGCGDRNTDADANMLIVNGATTAGKKIWCQTHQVYPNITYNLSAYFQELHNQNYPILQWNVNGVDVGSPVTAFVIPCIFKQASATWNSGVNTSATFCLVGGNLGVNGNDFAIDQIEITPSGNIYDTITITVQNAPAVALGSDTSICGTQSVVLDAGNAGASYQWSDNSTAQTLTVTTPGNYAVTVSNGNCSATDAVDVSAFVLQATTASVNTTCGQDNGQASIDVTNGAAPYTYVWSNTGNTDTLWNLPGGTYNVTATDANGCTATGSAIVNTSGAGNVAITGITTQICASDSGEICAPDNYTSYLWNNGATSKCIYPKLAGNYYVTVTDAANCTSTSNAVAVSVYPVPPVSISVNGDTLKAFNATAYQWYYNGNIINGATNSTYIAANAGSYSVQVTDSNGCVATSNPIVYSSINELNNSSLQVYPNPNATGSWQLVVSASLTGSAVEVTDVTGKVVYNAILNQPTSVLNLQVPAGVYLLKVAAPGKNYLHKLIKL